MTRPRRAATAARMNAPPPNLDTIAKRLVWAREQRGWKQKDLIARSGVGQQNVSDIERGVNLKPTDIPALAEACGVRALWLQKGIGPHLDAPRPAPPTDAELYLMREFGARLESARKTKRLTQEALEAKMRVGVGVIRQFEGGAAWPGVIEMHQLAEFLDAPLDWLIRGDEIIPPLRRELRESGLTKSVHEHEPGAFI